MADIAYVDRSDNVIGSGTRKDALANGVMHRVARVILLNSRGEMLIQKRSAHISLPNLWDQSAAGHVDAGEEYADAAVRELAEETGVSSASLTEVSKYYSEEDIHGQIAKRFSTIFVGHYDGPVQPNPEEVSESRWVPLNELRTWMHERPEAFTEGFRVCLQHFQVRDFDKRS